MWHLLRLFLLSVGLGAGLCILWQVRSLFFAVFYPSVESGGLLLRWRLPQISAPYRFLGAPHPPRFFRHARDFLVALFVALVFCLFFYAANDGIPRLFAFLGSAFGVALWKKTLGRPLSSLLTVLGHLVRYAALLVLLPPLVALRRIGKRFLSCLIKAAASLIKKQKKLYTNHKSRRYVKRSVSSAAIAGLSRRLAAALREEETEGDNV